MPIIFIPPSLRRFTGGEAQCSVDAATLREAVDALETRYSGIRAHLVDNDRLLPGLAAVIDGEATADGLRARLSVDAEVHFLPAISGGSSAGHLDPSALSSQSSLGNVVAAP